LTRTAAWALSVTLAFGAAIAPCAAEGDGPKVKTQSLTQLSPAGRRLLAVVPSSSGARAQSQPGSVPTSPGSFLHSKRGAITMVLMSAGTVFTVWSISHDRKPVKSPIR
jgi:hypothetical protein